MSLILGDVERACIAAEGRRTYPNECCGFLLGRDVGEHAQVEEVVPAVNARDDSPRNRYLIPPEAFLHVQRDANARGLDIVGFYHSHPDVEAYPSAFDREHAWNGYYYVIVSVREGEPREVRAWRLRDERDGFDEAVPEISLEAAANGTARNHSRESRVS